MREWCGCGSGIVGKPKYVKKWRKNHLHPVDGPQGTTSDTEIADQGDPDEVRIGFIRNPE